MRCLISLAIALFSSGVYCSTAAASFLAGVGKILLKAMKMIKEMNMATTEAMKL